MAFETGSAFDGSTFDGSAPSSRPQDPADPPVWEAGTLLMQALTRTTAYEGLACGCPGCVAGAERQTKGGLATIPATGQIGIDALVAAIDDSPTARWNLLNAVGQPLTPTVALGTAVTVPYAFLTAVPADYDTLQDPDRPTAATFVTLTEAQRAATRLALAQYEEVSLIRFTEVTDEEAALLRFGSHAMDGSLAGYAYYPSFAVRTSDDIITAATPSGIAGDSWLAASAANAAPTPGTDAFNTVIHELGHALGLKHPFEGVPSVSVAEDSVRYTVMSYTYPDNSEIWVEYPDRWGSALVSPRTLMLYDILAVQYLYGVNTATRAGDTVYSWQPNERFFETIWDGGGTDTVDASAQTLDCVIDLRDGHFSSIAIRATEAQKRMDLPADADYLTTPTYDGRDNLAIAYGAVIENARGGAGNDTLIGNAAANLLEGGAGDDRLSGGTGDDTIDGGSGVDVIRIEAARSAVTLEATGPWGVRLSGAATGTDVASGVELIRFDDQVVYVTLPVRFEAVQPDGGGAFDEAFYLARWADVRAAVNAGQVMSGLEHYLAFGQAEGRDPTPLFDEEAYLARWADVRAAVEAGQVRSGYEHYLNSGWREDRDPSAWFDLSAYLQRNPDVADAGIDPLRHWLVWGIGENRIATAADTGLWLA
ncbi:M10 family metallopeptidase [Rhodospirillum centenum]|uniref:Serralysin, putative n=1 Tax=Rhodospirillum centenum (strain ATCC 51521 / SW) TaxID=414684 RepID=B6IWS4_RHOCS|nr:M10 family metallopeptidase [Rhodospirillum centenum]ACJ00748.1 Serralysin precursor, putative [Rhodospirillum centenum SW]